MPATTDLSAAAALAALRESLKRQRFTLIRAPDLNAWLATDDALPVQLATISSGQTPTEAVDRLIDELERQRDEFADALESRAQNKIWLWL